jgi:hypothetical protein
MSFELNINNYNKTELMEIFELPVEYDKKLLDEKVSFLRNSILSDKTINKLIKQKTLLFIKEAATKLEPIDLILNNSSLLTATQLITGSSSQEFIIPLPHIVDNLSLGPQNYANSMVSDFYAGRLDPLQKRTLKQHLNIDSRFRNNYNNSMSSNFQIDLPKILMKVMSMQINTFEFTSSLYNISSKMKNNFFAISLNTGYIAMIILQKGIYTQTNIIIAINLAIQLAATNIFISDPVSSAELSSILVSTLQGNECVITASSLSPFKLYFNTYVDGSENTAIQLSTTLGWMLGFREGIYTGMSSYTSEGNIDVVYPKYVYLYVDDYNKNVNNEFFNCILNDSLLSSNILARLTLNSTTQTFFQNNLIPLTTYRAYFGPVNIQKLHIQLLDEFGRNVDTQYMDYSFCLTIDLIHNL